MGAGRGSPLDEAAALQIHESMRHILERQHDAPGPEAAVVHQPLSATHGGEACGARNITASPALRSCAALPPFMLIAARTSAAVATHMSRGGSDRCNR